MTAPALQLRHLAFAFGITSASFKYCLDAARAAAAGDVPPDAALLHVALFACGFLFGALWLSLLLLRAPLYTTYQRRFFQTSLAIASCYSAAFFFCPLLPQPAPRTFYLQRMWIFPLLTTLSGRPVEETMPILVLLVLPVHLTLDTAWQYRLCHTSATSGLEAAPCDSPPRFCCLFLLRILPSVLGLLGAMLLINLFAEDKRQAVISQGAGAQGEPAPSRPEPSSSQNEAPGPTSSRCLGWSRRLQGWARSLVLAECKLCRRLRSALQHKLTEDVAKMISWPSLAWIVYTQVTRISTGSSSSPPEVLVALAVGIAVGHCEGKDMSQVWFDQLTAMTALAHDLLPSHVAQQLVQQTVASWQQPQMQRSLRQGRYSVGDSFSAASARSHSGSCCSEAAFSPPHEEGGCACGACAPGYRHSSSLCALRRGSCSMFSPASSQLLLPEQREEAYTEDDALEDPCGPEDTATLLPRASSMSPKPSRASSMGAGGATILLPRASSMSPKASRASFMGAGDATTVMPRASSMRRYEAEYKRGPEDGQEGKDEDEDEISLAMGSQQHCDSLDALLVIGGVEPDTLEGGTEWEEGMTSLSMWHSDLGAPGAGEQLLDEALLPAPAAPVADHESGRPPGAGGSVASAGGWFAGAGGSVSSAPLPLPLCSGDRPSYQRSSSGGMQQEQQQQQRWPAAAATARGTLSCNRSAGHLPDLAEEPVATGSTLQQGCAAREPPGAVRRRYTFNFGSDCSETPGAGGVYGFLGGWAPGRRPRGARDGAMQQSWCGGGQAPAADNSPAVQPPHKLLAFSHSAVTVLFADIVGFTALSKALEPYQVFEFLNELYARYDAVVDSFRVYKVETIGDCYMCATGLLHEDPDHAAQMVRFAQAMQLQAAQVQMPDGSGPVRVRVGIHSGPLLSGVIGRIRKRYCVVGSTVNLASRMESTGVPGRVHVSADTHALVSRLREWEWECRGGVEVKGVGQMVTYMLKQDDAGDSAAS